MPIPRSALAVLLAGIAVLATATAGSAQTSQPPSGGSGTATPVNLVGPPEPVLYRLFFSVTAPLARQIQDREAVGQDAGALWRGFEDETYLNYAQCSAVFQVAADFEATDTAQLTEQRKIAAEWHAAQRAHRALGLAAPPSAVPRIDAIQAERDANAMQARAKLRKLLGDEGFETLEIYVHNVIGRNTKLFVLKTPGVVGPGGDHQ